VVDLATAVYVTRDAARPLRWMDTMIDESAPISAFRDSSAPGAKLRTIGGLLLVFSALYGYYLFRERAVERWTPVNAHVISARPIDSNSGRSSILLIETTARYDTPGGGYDFVSTYSPAGFFSYHERIKAEAKAAALIGIAEPVRYDPDQPKNVLSEDDVTINRGAALVARLILLFAVVAGSVLLALGLNEQQPAPPSTSVEPLKGGQS
jgi:hypothetical protein